MKWVVVLFGLASAIKPSAPAEAKPMQMVASKRAMVVKYMVGIRFCNAYAAPSDDSSLDSVSVSIMHKGGSSTDMDGSVPFNQCREYKNVQLVEGDRFSVKSGTDGTKDLADFVVTKFDQMSDPLLMLILSRKSPDSHEAHFVSHQYARLKNSQIAVMDLFGGESQSELVIRTQTKDEHGVLHMESLKPNTVMAFEQDKDYEIVLVNSEKKETVRKFHAKGGVDYVTAIVGNEGSKHDNPELLFFPQAGAFRPAVLAVAMLFAAIFH